jgi:hypothetical protein
VPIDHPQTTCSSSCSRLSTTTSTFARRSASTWSLCNQTRHKWLHTVSSLVSHSSRSCCWPTLRRPPNPIMALNFAQPCTPRARNTCTPRARRNFAPDHSQGAGGHQLHPDPQGCTSTGHRDCAELVSYLQAMMGEDTNSVYTKLAYGMSSKSNLSEEERKPHTREHKKSQRSMSQGGHGKQKKDKENKPKKNTCPLCKKFHHKKPHQVELDKCMWNKKYKGYRFKLIDNKFDVAFKPCHKFSAGLSGYSSKGHESGDD